MDREEQRAVKFTLDKESPIQGMEGFEPLALVVGASGGLAVDGDDVVPLWPHGGDEGLKAAREQRKDRSGSSNRAARRKSLKRRIRTISSKSSQVAIVGAGHQEQDLVERVSDAPAFALVVQLGKSA